METRSKSAPCSTISCTIASFATSFSQVSRARPLTKRDQEIAAKIGPRLAERGLLLVGLDVIGDWLTEINVTSPTCFQEITQQTGFSVAGMFIDALEAACKA